MYLSCVCGNEKTKTRLSSVIRNRTLSHAYILCGEKGSGRHTLALSIVASLNCERRDEVIVPCMKCTTCRRIFSMQFTDVKVLSMQGAKSTIGVDEVRVIREDMFLSASESEYKVYIFEDADKLTVQAQNALLKVLEEPINNVLIFLLCERRDKLLTTIRSRAPMITMEYLSTALIDKYLEENSEEGRTLKRRDAEGYREVLRHADGSIGRALSMLNADSIREYQTMHEEVRSLLLAFSPHTPYATLLSEVSSLPKNRADFIEVMEEVIRALRDAIASKRAENITLLFFKDKEECEEVSRHFTLTRLLQVYDLVTRAIEQASANANMTVVTSLLATNKP